MPVSLTTRIAEAIRDNITYTVDDDGLHGVNAAIDDIVDVVHAAARSASDNIQTSVRERVRSRPEMRDITEDLLGKVAMIGELIHERTPAAPPAADHVERVARTLARAANGDYWVDEIVEWEGREEWEREAHPDNCPSSAYEDRDYFRKLATAVLTEHA